MSADKAYDALVEHLQFPGSTRLRSVLEYLMTPDQAKIVVTLPGSPQEAAELAGMDPIRVRDALDELFFKGVVFPRGDFRNREFYRFARSIGQLHDATMASEGLDLVKDRQLFELWWDFKDNEWFPSTAKAAQERGNPRLRIIPAYNSIKELDGILTCENYQEILKAQERIAVVPCPCRLNTAAIGQPCDIHDETAHWACLQFGRAADYVVTRGSGKELSLEEALELNDVIEESGLLHWWSNNTNTTALRFACNCCRDCCSDLVPLDQAGLPIGTGWEKSRYQAYVETEDCDGCQVCIDRCPFDAIEMERPEGSKKYKAVVDAEKCFGCGVCVVGCTSGALKMKTVRPPEHIPEPAQP
ncbi:MAG TPA: 4Fe-4S binding protein [Dehalococcoidia bacterium]|nr:4Fe-4S binding protein [Dehalococcoidia bacterium]